MMKRGHGKSIILGVLDSDDSYEDLLEKVLGTALVNATDDFYEKNNRPIDYDTLTFRGGFTSTEAVIEVWDEGGGA